MNESYIEWLDLDKYPKLPWEKYRYWNDSGIAFRSGQAPIFGYGGWSASANQEFIPVSERRRNEPAYFEEVMPSDDAIFIWDESNGTYKHYVDMFLNLRCGE